MTAIDHLSRHRSTDASDSDELIITPWIDPTVERRGHDPRSPYAERYWLPTLGPTACWLLRRLAEGFEAHPDGYRLDLAVTARSLGLAPSGHRGTFAKAFGRCVLFGLAHQRSGGYSVRRALPDLPRRHLLRLPGELQASHDAWLAGAAPEAPGITAESPA